MPAQRLIRRSECRSKRVRKRVRSEREREVAAQNNTARGQEARMHPKTSRSSKVMRHSRTEALVCDTEVMFGRRTSGGKLCGYKNGKTQLTKRQGVYAHGVPRSSPLACQKKEHVRFEPPCPLLAKKEAQAIWESRQDAACNTCAE